MAVSFDVNGERVSVDAPPGMPLLWVLRDVLDLKGTKFGCGISQCGACTVHVDGSPARSCQTPVSAVAGRQVTTIEGLSTDGSHPLQRAWVEEDVPQCGYCQSGQIMTAAALLERNPSPSDDEIAAAMNGNLCRCGTYLRIRKAVRRAAGTATDDASSGPGGGTPRTGASASRGARRDGDDYAAGTTLPNGDARATRRGGRGSASRPSSEKE